MKRILILLPDSSEGKLIMDGFANGFELNKCRVERKYIKELSTEILDQFSPDMIFGYNYSFLKDEKCTGIISGSKCKNIVFYFAEISQKELHSGKNKTLFEKLKQFSPKIFVWDKTLLQNFKNGTYLKLAVNHKKYKTSFSGYKYPITFVSENLTNDCLQILCEVVKEFKNKLKIFCDKKQFSKSVEKIKKENLLNDNDLQIYSNSYEGFAETEAERAKIFNSSKINLNITSNSKTSPNYRIFEILASEGFLITDNVEDLDSSFVISKQLEVYKSIEDLKDKINFYLNNLNIAQRIAQLGKFEVVESNIYSARAGIILKKVFN